MGAGILIVYLVIVLVTIIGLWKVFEKAGEPGWAAIVPLYNIAVICKIAGKPMWWAILYFVPFVNFVIAILVSIGVANRFGKGTGFALGLTFLPFIFYPLLGFSDSRAGAPAMA
ncbi:MAG: signal peptidase I [Acidobacteria bacterium]|nr:signal peptidase I [Acidobacteriota bacterium]